MSIYEDRIVSYLGLVSTVLPSLLRYQIEKKYATISAHKKPFILLFFFFFDPVTVKLASQRPSIQPQINAKIPDTFHLLSEPSKNDYWLLRGLTDCYSLKRGTQKQPKTQG